MKTYQYYENENAMCMVVGTTYSFQCAADLIDWAEKEGCELEEVEAPDPINYDGLVW